MSCLTLRADYWVSSSGAGLMDGSSLNNCAIQTNSSAAVPSAGQTLHIVGAVTNAMNTVASGTSGNPVTILFEPGAKGSSPAWLSAPNCFILMTGAHDVVINGGVNGTNGIIECTANGVSLANQVSASGIVIQKSYNITISNMVFQNLYKSVAGLYNSSGSGIGILFNNIDASPCYSNTVVNCVCQGETFGIYPQYGPGWHDLIIKGCDCHDCNQGIYSGDENSSSTMMGLTITECHCYNWANWVDPSDSDYHNNGIFVFAANSGMLSNITISACHIGSTGYGPHQSGGMQIGGNVYNALVYNNICDSTDGSNPNDGFIYLWLKPAHASIDAIYNNTVNGQNAAQAIELFGDFQGEMDIAPTYFVTNNLMKNTDYAISQFFYGNMTVFTDKNLIYGYISDPFNHASAGSANRVSVSTWQGLGYDAHLNQGNPQLTATYALGVGSAALGTGANLTGIIPQIDFLGLPSTGNIGAMGNAWQNYNAVFTTH